MISKKELNFKFLYNNILTFILLAITCIVIKDINDTKLIFLSLLAPLFNIVISLILIYLSIFERKNSNLENSKTYYSLNKYISLYLNVGQVLVILSLTLIDVSFLTLFMEMLGLLLLISGNYLPKLKESKTIKSLSFNVNKDKNKWNTFMRISGFTYMLVGLIIMMLGLFNEYIVILISILLIIISGVLLQLYSIALGKR